MSTTGTAPAKLPICHVVRKIYAVNHHGLSVGYEVSYETQYPGPKNTHENTVRSEIFMGLCRVHEIQRVTTPPMSQQELADDFSRWMQCPVKVAQLDDASIVCTGNVPQMTQFKTMKGF